MQTGFGVDRTIRNQRYHGWPAWLLLACWTSFWALAVGAGDLIWPFEFHRPITFLVGFLILISFVLALVIAERQPPKRIQLGEELLVSSVTRFQPKHIQVFRFESNPCEDFEEDNLPIQWCQLVIEFRNRTPIRLIVSIGDARSVHEWAEQKDVAVADPNGYSTSKTPEASA